MISFKKKWNLKKALRETNENWSKKTKPTPPLVLLDAKGQQTTQCTLSSRQLCRTAAAPRKVGILPWCFVTTKNTSLQWKHAKASEALRLQGPWPTWLCWLHSCLITALIKLNRIIAAAISTCRSTQHPMPAGNLARKALGQAGFQARMGQSVPLLGNPASLPRMHGIKTGYAATIPAAHRHNTGFKAGIAYEGTASHLIAKFGMPVRLDTCIQNIPSYIRKTNVNTKLIAKMHTWQSSPLIPKTRFHTQLRVWHQSGKRHPH